MVSSSAEWNALAVAPSTAVAEESHQSSMDDKLHDDDGNNNNEIITEKELETPFLSP